MPLCDSSAGTGPNVYNSACKDCEVQCSSVLIPHVTAIKISSDVRYTLASLLTVLRRVDDVLVVISKLDQAYCFRYHRKIPYWDRCKTSRRLNSDMVFVQPGSTGLVLIQRCLCFVYLSEKRLLVVCAVCDNQHIIDVYIPPVIHVKHKSTNRGRTSTEFRILFKGRRW